MQKKQTNINWRDKFINLGYSDKQVSELLKYPAYILQYIHESGYINTGMNCGQIKQVLLGITKNYLSIFVKYYAKNEYSTAHMRVLRILLNIDLDPNYISKYMNPKELNYKQCFVLGMVLINSKEFNIEAYLDFIKKADKAIDKIYRFYNYRVSNISYDHTVGNASYKNAIIEMFNKDFYAYQISYQLYMKTESKKDDNK